MFTHDSKSSDDYNQFSSDSYYDEIAESDDYQTMRSLGTDMMTTKLPNFKYNQSLIDVHSIRDSVMVHHNKLAQK